MLQYQHNMATGKTLSIGLGMGASDYNPGLGFKSDATIYDRADGSGG